ncbi:hypothetical protein [Frankia sp. Cppng1_Ct_nod]|uniref:hypothetical protein n=1 Tax=Frankia sp. Cppng1_Ct_nod TaxID=2897162 RepID=UPI0013EF5CC7|nr:hypothetical protein [Frankia sp. Cppng1_Ct_nod]
MMIAQESPQGIQLSRGLLVGGGAMVGIGGLLGFAGIALVGSALVSATQRWVQQLELPPSEIAKLKWQQARAATTAGARAWQSGPPTESPS